MTQQRTGQGTGAGSAGARRSRIKEHSERRRAARAQRIYYVRLSSGEESFRAMVMNASRTGVLLSLDEADFGIAASARGNVEMVGRKVALHFAEGMVIGFPTERVDVEADPVHVTSAYVGTEPSVYVGCRFRRLLTSEECAKLRIPEGEEDVPCRPAWASAEPTSPLPDPLPPAHAKRGNGQTLQGGRPTILDLMKVAVEREASDLHLKAGSPPRLRVDGDLIELGKEPLGDDEVRAMIRTLLRPDQLERFHECGDLDTAYTLAGQGRFRVNVLRARDRVGLAIRRISEKVPTIAALRLSPLCKELADRPRGLVLVTGPTGSGKSTTLAAMLNHVNRTRACHILTMEDPIEYLHTEIKAHVTQREVGRDTEHFASALKRALRQDPDVILVGEMRDLETISLAVTAAETGHQVFATLHTTSAALTIDRIVDVFPPVQQRQIRMQLADCLQGIISQTIVPKIGGGVVVAQEILVVTDAVRALIRESKTPQITNVMQTGAKEGMQTLEDALNDLVARGLVTREMALAKANVRKHIRQDGKPARRPARLS